MRITDQTNYDKQHKENTIMKTFGAIVRFVLFVLSVAIILFLVSTLMYVGIIPLPEKLSFISPLLDKLFDAIKTLVESKVGAPA